jgi:hypothetical protein
MTSEEDLDLALSLTQDEEEDKKYYELEME